MNHTGTLSHPGTKQGMQQLQSQEMRLESGRKRRWIQSESTTPKALMALENQQLLAMRYNVIKRVKAHDALT